MDICDELEQMALNAAGSDPSDEPQPSSQQIIFRWHKLFGYTYAEAADMILKNCANLSWKKVNDEHWEIVIQEMEGQGYGREAYEHEPETGARRVKLCQAKVGGRKR